MTQETEKALVKRGRKMRVRFSREPFSLFGHYWEEGNMCDTLLKWKLRLHYTGELLLRERGGKDSNSKTTN